jgi:hypothetical protein
MPASFLSRITLRNKAALAAVGLCITALSILWFVLPGIIQTQAERFVAQHTGHRLTLDRPEIKLFDLSLRFGKLQLNDPADKPLLAFDSLLIDLSASSLPRRSLVFDAIRIDGLAVTLEELAGGTLNWSPFLTAFQSKEEQAQTGLPRIDIDSLVLAGGRLDFADRRSAAGFATRVEPFDLNLSDLSTLPDDKGRYKLTARTPAGARLSLEGELALNPLAVAGKLTLDDLNLAQLAPYLGQILAAPPAGTAGLAASYRIGNGGDRLDVAIDGLTARLTKLRLPLKAPAGAVAVLDAIELQDGSFDLERQELAIGSVRVGSGSLALPELKQAAPRFSALTLEKARIDLGKRLVTLDQATLTEGRLEATRDATGRIELLAALQPGGAPAAGAAAPTQAAPPWHFRLARFAAEGTQIVLRDSGVSPAAELALDNLGLTLADISDDPNSPWPLTLAFDVRSGGRFAGQGTVVAGVPAADLKFKLTDLALKPAQAYLARKTTLTLARGNLSCEGQLAYGAQGPSYRGDFAVRDLRLDEDGGNPLLAWKSFGSSALTLTPQQLDLGELRLNGLDTQLIIDKDKNINFKQVLRRDTDAQDKLSAAAPAPAPPDTAPFAVNIDRIRFYNGEMDFADHSLLLPFGTRIHRLRGSIGTLSNQRGAPGQLELDGEVDDYGMARAVGQIDLFAPTDFMDLRVIFRNVEMPRLTPYTATFAGRKIAAGKLSLDLQYKIEQRRLRGENRIVMEQLKLGERVASPSAKELPLDLALAVLQDADGRIDLGLPIAGNLDDPEFSYGQIVWQAIGNVLGKIATAPFRALGALLGNGEQPAQVVFEAGAARPLPPEREKLVRIAAMLAKRPALVLAVGGTHAEADRVALQDIQLRRTVLARMGQRVSERGDPGPLSSRQPKVQAALEGLYGERFGTADLAALKEGFRRANPGQLEEGLTGKMMSRLSGLLREKKTLSEAEVGQLKGADFHTVLYERLRAAETITDERLQTLAQNRSEHARATLQEAGVATERLRQLPPERADSSVDGVPLKLVLEAAAPGAKTD